MEALRSKPWSFCMRSVSVLSLVALSMLGACGRSNPPATVPAGVSAPAAVTAVPPAATQPAPAEASVPAAVTVAAAATGAAPAAASVAGPESAGSVALAQGSVTDQATDGTSRQLKDGDTVYPGDAFTLGDDSYLDLDLEDGGRILLRPDTSFQIQEYHFDPDAHPAAGEQPLLATSQQKPESAFFKLVKGGLRAVDGLIGHSEPQNFHVETPVATIGVRGTAFDVRYCGDDCKDETDAGGAPQNGLYTAVSDGSIGVKNDSGEAVTKAGEYSYVASRHVAVQHLAAAPHALRHMALPPKLKARADKTHEQIQAKRQARRQQVLEQRRQRAAAKAGSPAEKTPQGKAPAGKPEGMTRAERRQQRLQERREGKAGVREQRQQVQAGDKAAGEPVHPQENAAPAGGAERRQERLKQRQERQAEKPRAGPAAAPVQREQEKPDARAGCKDKKKKRRKDKDKDKCGDG